LKPNSGKKITKLSIFAFSPRGKDKIETIEALKWAQVSPSSKRQSKKRLNGTIKKGEGYFSSFVGKKLRPACRISCYFFRIRKKLHAHQF
jgi:hypothetical protein